MDFTAVAVCPVLVAVGGYLFSRRTFWSRTKRKEIIRAPPMCCHQQNCQPGDPPAALFELTKCGNLEGEAIGFWRMIACLGSSDLGGPISSMPGWRDAAVPSILPSKLPLLRWVSGVLLVLLWNSYLVTLNTSCPCLLLLVIWLQFSPWGHNGSQGYVHFASLVLSERGCD